jgi:hypothetical protein
MVYNAKKLTFEMLKGVFVQGLIKMRNLIYFSFL